MEWTSTLSNGLPLWELKSRWTPEFSESDFRGLNSLNWKFPYIIGNFLERRCLKLSSYDPFGYLKHKLWPKEGLGVNLTIWSRPIKVGNRPEFLACRWRDTYHWKALNEGYNFDLGLTFIRGLHTKLCASKVVGVLILGISGLPLGSLGKKWHLGVGPMARHKEYYKGEGGGFPQVRAMVSFVNLCLLVARSCTKSASIMH
jgi:hypothetical protein